MSARFQDLNFYELDDGSIRLEQIGYAGEVAVIDAHPEQLLYISRRLCGMKPETARAVVDLERRIAVLTDKLQTLVCNSAFRSDLLEGTETGFEYIAKLDGLLDLALEFDGGRLTPEEPPQGSTQEICGDAFRQQPTWNAAAEQKQAIPINPPHITAGSCDDLFAPKG